MPVAPYRRQVAPQALPNVRVNTNAPLEAFGGGAPLDALNRATANLTTQAQKLATEEQDRADQARLNEVRDLTNRKELALIYDPNTGIRTKQGKDAFGLPEEVQKDFDSFSEEVEGTLANQRQKDAARAFLQQRRQSILSTTKEHVFREQQRYDESVFESGLESSKERGSVDTRNAPLEEKAIRQLVEQRAVAQGWDPERTKQEVQKNTSDLHARAVNGLLAGGNDLSARKYFDTVKDSLDPDIKTKLTTVLEEGSVRGESQRQSDVILSKYPNDLGTALAEARKIEDPKTRDETERRVRDGYSQAKAAQEDRRTRIFDSAANRIEQTKNLDSIPPATWAALKLPEKRALEQRVAQLREGIPPSTDWGEYYALKNEAASAATRDSFLKKNLMLVRPKMADAEFKELVTLQQSIRAGDGKGEKELDGYRTDSAIVEDGLRSIGIDPGARKGRFAEQGVLFRRQVDEQMAAMQQRTGKKASNKEVQEIVDGLLVKGVTEKSFFGDTRKRAFELQAGEQLEIDAKDVPPSEVAKIRQALRREPTAKEILDLYSRKLERLRRGQ